MITNTNLIEHRARRGALQVGLVTLVLMIVLCAVALAGAHGDALTFANIGTRFSQGDPQGSTGYDGQFVYFIARDGAQAVPYIDGPSLRYQRIVYPVMARLLALGNPAIVPWMLILVNIAAQSAGAVLLAYLLAQWRASPWSALIYSLWVGSVFAVRLDLNEPLCLALALVAVVAYLHHRYRATILFLVLSTLTKELGLIFAAGLALHAFFTGARRWSPLLIGGPLLAFLVWWGVLRLWFGTLPTIYPAARFNLLPLYGMFTELQQNPIEFVFLLIWLGIPAVVIFILAAIKLWQTRGTTLGAALAMAGAGFVLIMPPVSWQDPAAAYRVGVSVVIGGLLFVGQCYPQRLPWLAALWLPSLLVALMTPRLWIGT